MGLQFRRFSRRKSDASPARKYSNGSQHDSSASQDSSSSSSLPESTEVGNIVRSCIQQLVKSQQPLNEGHQEGLDALKSLFALSSPEDSRRRDVICVAGGALLPVLFSYIDRADGVYLQTALLVVNNLSTVTENKRPLAMQGAGILARVLTRDPSCHLAAIILVNLTFCDAELRRDLVLTQEFGLVETLALTLLICSMDELDFCSKGQSKLSLPPRVALKELMSDPDTAFAIGNASSSPSKPFYPSTLKWTLSALKNLTRPSKYDSVAHAVLQSGIIPHVLRLATLKESDLDDWSLVQDAALYIIVHLTAIPSVRPELREIVPPALKALTSCVSTGQDTEKALLQRVKARVALAFLCGSEGHYGQPVCPRHLREGNENAASSSLDVDSSSYLQVNDAEAEQLLELLTNMLHQRSKDGPAGYSSSTFSVKYVLFAIRCLLTQAHNQSCMAKTIALPCNALLAKAIAMHLWQPDVIHLDPEAAEHAIFSLYLMSNHGFRVSTMNPNDRCIRYCFDGTRTHGSSSNLFQTPFLPYSFGNDADLKKSLAAKIFYAYRKRSDITPAGKHAAEQLLLRLRYMIFQGSASESVSRTTTPFSDFELDRPLIQASQLVMVPKLTFGACPRKDIFDRSILRSRAHQEHNHNHNNSNNLHDNMPHSADCFPSALLAAQDFSFGSTKVRHVGHIDVVQIANNIANSANGQKTQSYSFVWSWQPDATSSRQQQQLKNPTPPTYRRQSSSGSFLSSFGGGVNSCHSQRKSSRSSLTKRVLSQLNLDRLCGSETTATGCEAF